MNLKRFFLLAMLVLFASPAMGQAFVTATITVTNVPGVGTNWIVNGVTRTLTNSPGTPPQSWITIGASVGATASNLYSHILRYPYLTPQLIPSFSSTNVITLKGTAVSITTNNYFSVTYSSPSGTNLLSVVQVPFESVVGDTNRTNNADWIVGGINKYARTNSFNTNAVALSNFLTKGASPQQSVGSPVQFNGILRGAGGVALTNGFTSAVTNINSVSSNHINYGNAIRSEGPGGNSFQMGSNAWALGSRSVAIGNSASATNNDSLAIGTTATATNLFSISIGSLARSLADYAISLGYSATATNGSISIGTSATSGESSVAIGNGTTATGTGGAVAVGSEDTSASGFASIAIGAAAQATAAHAISIGKDSVASHSNSVAFGPPDHAGTAVATTDTNQIRLGVSTTRISSPGLYESPKSTNAQFSGTNIWRGDVNYPWYSLTTLGDGVNNVAVPFGTNVFIRITGPTTSPTTICGAIAGATTGGRDGQPILIWNNSAASIVLAQNTVDATSANRFANYGGGDVTIPPDGFAWLVYSASVLRWKVTGTYPVTAFTTNAVAYGENLSLTNATTFGVWYQIQGQSNIQFRTLRAGANVVITNEGTNLVIASTASGSGGGATNAVVSGINLGLTNATRMGIFYRVDGSTNIEFRTVSAGNGIINTNQGTNVVTAIDPAVVASQANLTAASNTLNTAIDAVITYVDAADLVLLTAIADYDTITSNSLRTTIVDGLTNKVEKLNGVATNLTVYSGSPGLTAVPQIGMATNVFQVLDTNLVARVFVNSNGVLYASNVVFNALGFNPITFSPYDGIIDIGDGETRIGPSYLGFNSPGGGFGIWITNSDQESITFGVTGFGAMTNALTHDVGGQIGAWGGMKMPTLTASRVMVLNSAANPTNSAAVSTTELEFLDGATSAIQTQMDGRQNGSAVLTNLVGTVANNATNENSAALQINAGTLTLSPGVLSNLVASTIDVPAGNIISNVVAMKFNIWTNYVKTVSNLVFSFNTNRYELKNQTNVIFTNLVEEATAVGADMDVHVHNTTGVTMGLMWPAYGAQHGYFFHTNANNPILTSTTLTTGKHGVASFTAFGTNIFATWREWP